MGRLRAGEVVWGGANEGELRKPERAWGALRGTMPAADRRLSDGLLFSMDALEFLRNVRGAVAALVFLDPPFNLGKRYGERPPGSDRRGEEVYEELLHDVVRESIRILKPGGSLFVYHVPEWAVRIGEWLRGELEFKHWIAVAMKGGFPRERRLYPAHYAILHYAKGQMGGFTRPKIPPARCRHCKEVVKDYGGYWKNVEDGLNLSDIWDDLSPVRHKRHKNRRSNELPLTLTRRIVAMVGGTGELVVDPFAGAGTMLVAARERRMEFVACDRERSCLDVIERRLQGVETK